MTMRPGKVVGLDDVSPIRWGGDEAARGVATAGLVADPARPTILKSRILAEGQGKVEY